MKIVFIEAPDCSGKTTVINGIMNTLNKVYEINDNSIEEERLPNYKNHSGKLLRRLINSSKSECSEIEFQALMGLNYRETLSKLKNKDLVICSRGFLSMRAYSCYFDKANEHIYSKFIDNFKDWLKDNGISYINILLDVPVEVCMERLKKRKHVEEVFENEKCLSSVKGSMDRWASYNKDTFVVDNNRDIKATVADCLSIIDEFVSKEVLKEY